MGYAVKDARYNCLAKISVDKYLEENPLSRLINSNYQAPNYRQILIRMDC